VGSGSSSGRLRYLLALQNRSRSLVDEYENRRRGEHEWLEIVTEQRAIVLDESDDRWVDNDGVDSDGGFAGCSVCQGTPGRAHYPPPSSSSPDLTSIYAASEYDQPPRAPPSSRRGARPASAGATPAAFTALATQPSPITPVSPTSRMLLAATAAASPPSPSPPSPPPTPGHQPATVHVPAKDVFVPAAALADVAALRARAERDRATIAELRDALAQQQASRDVQAGTTDGATPTHAAAAAAAATASLAARIAELEDQVRADAEHVAVILSQRDSFAMTKATLTARVAELETQARRDKEMFSWLTEERRRLLGDVEASSELPVDADGDGDGDASTEDLEGASGARRRLMQGLLALGRASAALATEAPLPAGADATAAGVTPDVVAEGRALAEMEEYTRVLEAQLQAVTAEAGRLERRVDELDRTILHLQAGRGDAPLEAPAPASFVAPSEAPDAATAAEEEEQEQEAGHRGEDADVDALRARVATLEERLRAATESSDTGPLLDHIRDLETQVAFLREESASAQSGGSPWFAFLTVLPISVLIVPPVSSRCSRAEAESCVQRVADLVTLLQVPPPYLPPYLIPI
jgi:hypothetical protein